MADSQDLYVNTSVRAVPRPTSPLWRSLGTGMAINPHSGTAYYPGSEAARTNGAGS